MGGPILLASAIPNARHRSSVLTSLRPSGASVFSLGLLGGGTLSLVFQPSCTTLLKCIMGFTGTRVVQVLYHSGGFLSRYGTCRIVACPLDESPETQPFGCRLYLLTKIWSSATVRGRNKRWEKLNLMDYRFKVHCPHSWTEIVQMQERGNRW